MWILWEFCTYIFHSQLGREPKERAEFKMCSALNQSENRVKDND